MSYDVYIGDHWHNYTSNMSEFFRVYVGGVREMDGLTGLEVADLITEGLHRIVEASCTELDPYNALNGWGSWETAMSWLMMLRDTGRAHPDEIVRVA